MFRHAEIWLAPYLRQALARSRETGSGPLRVYVAMADHFEPCWGKADLPTAMRRLDQWRYRMPVLYEKVGEYANLTPRHTFFYPLDEYRPEILDGLAELCATGAGEVEVHLHHQGETSAQLEGMLAKYAETLHQRHGLLRRDPDSGQITYGFVHGNWALDNSRPDGLWCGVNDELRILGRTGCYADFTLPSAPSPTQTRTINSIYYATDDPKRPKSHDRGRPARVGAAPSGDLLMVQGVLALNWRRRKWNLVPRLENSELAGHNPPSLERFKLWLKFAPSLAGAGNAVFIKLACHGAVEKNHEALLGEPALGFYCQVADYCRAVGYELRFVTCWEMVNIIHALERGEDLN